MNTYVGLIALGVIAVALSAYLPFVIPTKAISFITVIFASVFSLLITFVITRKWMDDYYQQKIKKLKQENERRIKRLKRDHDTTTLEKTIRDGTQTLIKNALDYFKIENIKNEIGTSAAIENLQLDKYGQIIELLADFSLILPDITENKKIVKDEITHQIKIYQIDENPFAMFLERILKKYTVTVNKKIKEKNEQEFIESVKNCPQCAEKIKLKAKVCKHCGYKFTYMTKSLAHKTIATDRVEKGKRLYRAGQYKDAIAEFNTAIELKANYAEAYFSRAMAYNKLGNSRKAEEDLNEASYLGYKKANNLLRKKSDRKIKKASA